MLFIYSPAKVVIIFVPARERIKKMVHELLNMNHSHNFTNVKIKGKSCRDFSPNQETEQGFIGKENRKKMV